jgi:putative glutamine amidotransferase
VNPLIGISVDWVDDQRGRAFGLHQLRAAYADAVVASGGIPVLLAPTLSNEALKKLMGFLEGLLITGGAFDVSPALYGEKPSPKLGRLAPERTEFELALLRKATTRSLPVLAICGGMQLLNVARGGSLYQHLPDDLPGLEHEQPGDRRLPGHAVQIEAGTRLATLVGNEPLPVNSSHHQGVKVVGTGLRVGARSRDGLVEAIEDPGTAFCLGVEWHPELLWQTEPRHRALFHGLTAAASATR